MLKKISILFIFFILFFGFSANARSRDDLIVVFNPNPLFNEKNFMPGQSLREFIGVKNKSGAEKLIVAEAANVDDPNNFGSVLNLQINEGKKSCFKGTLAEFFNAGEIDLSSLANNASTTYKFIITFNPEAGNDWQGKILNNFDVLVGFLGGEKKAAGSFFSSPAGGSNSPSSRPPADLSIPKESIHVLNKNETQVTVVWLTNHFSTSQVIYSAEGEPHSLDKNKPPYYGYSHAAPEPEDDTLVTFHTVTLTGLTPGTTYYYRCVSRASPPTFSYLELKFTTLPATAETNPLPSGAEAAGKQTYAKTGTNGAKAGVVKGAQKNSNGKVAGKEKVASPEKKASEVKNIQKKEKGYSLFQHWYVWLIVILLLILLPGIYYLKLKRNKDTKI